MLRRIIAGCLRFLYWILPTPLYDRLYRVAFSQYKAWRRGQYRRHALRGRPEDREKIDIVYHCLEFSLVGWQGMEATYDCTRQVLIEKIPGDLVECGVAQGGSALLIALVQKKYGGDSRRLWLFDSYEGLPDPTAKDFAGGRTGSHIRPLPKGSCLGTIEEVSRLLFAEHRLSERTVRLVKGWFENTLPATSPEIDAIALLRLDGDWYESTKVCLETLFDKVSSHGYVVLDDYFSCYGCQRATDEFLAARGLTATINPDGRGGAYFQKQ